MATSMAVVAVFDINIDSRKAISMRPLSRDFGSLPNFGNKVEAIF